MSLPLRGILIALLFTLPLAGHACSCAPWPGDRQDRIAAAVERADSVVIARALAEMQPAGGQRAYETTAFNVLHNWKGKRREKLKVLTASRPEFCGMSFSAGRLYILYLYGPDESGRFRTTSCTPSKLVREHGTDSDVPLLDKLTLEAGDNSSR